MSLTDLESRAKALLPAAAPAFQASVPASQGGASSPLLWLAVGLVLLYAGVVGAAAFFGLPSAERFMGNAIAQGSFVAIQVPLIGLLLNYRSKNKATAASVAIAAQQANGGAVPEAKGATDG